MHPVKRARSSRLMSGEWRLRPVLALAASVLLVGVVLLSRYPHGTSDAEFVSGRGQQLAQSLPDQSMVRLDTGTSLSTHYTRHERGIRLARGRAYFEVTHDGSRPFVVSAGSALVRAVGTKFDVYLRNGSTVVTVVEGKVAVWSARSQLPEGGSVAGDAVYVTAGQQLSVTDGVTEAAPHAVDASAQTAWLTGQLVFSDQPLGSVVEELNRYTTLPLQVTSASLRSQRISGRFATDDTVSFIAFLRTLPGVQVRLTPTAIEIDDR